MSESHTRTLRCAICKHSDFIQEETYTVKTPVRIDRGGQRFRAIAPNPSYTDKPTQTISRPKSRSIVCSNCGAGLPGVSFDNKVSQRLALTPQLERTLLDLHFYLWPEAYPEPRRCEHIAWHEDFTIFEWSSDTIEAVAADIHTALRPHPYTKGAHA